MRFHRADRANTLAALGSCFVTILDFSCLFVLKVALCDKTGVMLRNIISKLWNKRRFSSYSQAPILGRQSLSTVACCGILCLWNRCHAKHALNEGLWLPISLVHRLTGSASTGYIICFFLEEFLFQSYHWKRFLLSRCFNFRNKTMLGFKSALQRDFLPIKALPICQKTESTQTVICATLILSTNCLTVSHFQRQLDARSSSESKVCTSLRWKTLSLTIKTKISQAKEEWLWKCWGQTPSSIHTEAFTSIHHIPQHPPGETGSSWLGWVDTLLR